jgi:hypothetical protein
MGNDDDIAVLEGLGKIKGKEVRIDANGGWPPAKAEEMIVHLARLGVRIIEQPTDLKYIKDWKHLKGKNENVELFVDEGLQVLFVKTSYVIPKSFGGPLRGIEEQHDAAATLVGLYLDHSGKASQIGLQ